MTRKAAVVTDAGMGEKEALKDLREMAKEEGLNGTRALSNALLQRDSISKSDREALLEILKAELDV